MVAIGRSRRSRNDATIDSTLTGNCGLTKVDNGILALNASNSFTGGTTLTAGQLDLNNNYSLSTGFFDIDGGQIDNTNTLGAVSLQATPETWGGTLFTLGAIR